MERCSVQDYTARFRPAVWSVLVEGEYETATPLGREVSVTIDGDLGYDDPNPAFNGEPSVRWGKHDLWIIGVAFDQSKRAPIKVEFVIEGEAYDQIGAVDSETSITDINFRYGYSLFECEEDGFRHSPIIAGSYTDISLEVTELTINGISTGIRIIFEEPLPIPTIGVHLEVSYGNSLFSALFGGSYIDTSAFESTGIRVEAGIIWRLYDYVGLFASLHAIYADLDLGNEQINDLLLWGPSVGFEFRF